MNNDKLKPIVSWSLFASVTSLFILLILGYFGESCRFFDVLSNFNGQIFLLALLFLLITLLFKKPRKVQIANIAILALIIVITLTEILPWYYKSDIKNPMPQLSSGVGAETLDEERGGCPVLTPSWKRQVRDYNANGGKIRISLINVLKKNTHYDDVLDFVNDISPDLLIFMEIDDKWLNELLPLDSEYPHKIVSSRLGSDGIVIYSKLPVLKSEEVILSPKGRPNFKITLDVDGRQIDCLVAHPVSPTRKTGKWEDRNIHIANLAKLANSADNSVMIVADLNASMWSPFYRKLIADAKLRNARKGFGIHGTYPAPWALISGIPIDHILIDKNFSCISFNTGPHIGSDHLPIWADIALFK